MPGRGEIFLQHSVRALRIIRYCVLTTALFIVGAEAYIFNFVRGTDDVAGGVMMGAFIILVSAIIATAAAVFERKLKMRGYKVWITASMISTGHCDGDQQWFPRTGGVGAVG